LPAHPEFLTAFSAGIASGVLPPGLTTTAPDEAAQRFAIYRNNVTVSLIDALEQRFPVIRRLVGQDFFRAMARDFAQSHRPRSPVLFAWGDRFPDFLAAFPPLAPYPYMADVAWIEVARGIAYHAVDADPVMPADLAAAATDPAGLRLALHPSVQVLRLTHPAVSVWTANQPGKPPLSLAGRGPEIALIWRDVVFDVPVAAIGPGDAAMIEAILSGSSLMIAAEMAAFAEPAHTPQPMLVRLMQAGVIVNP
jgi:hypothetical protein